MKITSIKQQVKRQDRYSVFVDEKYAFSLSQGALLDQAIHIGLEVTGDSLQALKRASQLDKAYSLALSYVARRMRSEWELRDYLKRKDYDEDAAEYIVGKLSGFGYVDDIKFARSWVDNRRLLKSISKRRLIQELRAKRVSDEVVRAVIEDDQTTDRQTLKQLVINKRRQSRYQDTTKLMQYLARQGYSYDDIKTVLSDPRDE